MERPVLNKSLDSDTFRKYYYLKEELVSFCRENGLPLTGGKIELTDRIAHYLDTGEKTSSRSPVAKRTVIRKMIREDDVIEANIVCSELHRAFFKTAIGPKFSFKVAFQKWLRMNAGKTYADAIAAYHQIIDQSKYKKHNIDRQFEYNTYIRDFFADNKGKCLEDAIKCWKFKKSLPGNNKYNPSDLTALT